MPGAEEASPGKPAVQSIADIPKGYETGEKSVSRNGRFDGRRRVHRAVKAVRREKTGRVRYFPR